MTGTEDTTITGAVPEGTDPDGGTLTYELVDEEPLAGLTFNGETAASPMSRPIISTAR